MKYSFLSLLLLFAFSFTYGQAPQSVAKQTMSYTTKSPLASIGFSVAYNPLNGLYYTAVYSTEKDYPLEVFDQNGQFKGAVKSNCDVRGLWWNDKRAQLEGNGPGDVGFVGYQLDGNGLVARGGCRVVSSADVLPLFNSVAAYDPVHDQVMAYSPGMISLYEREGFHPSGTKVLKGKIKADGFSENTVAYSGLTGFEIAVLDYQNKEVLFFNANGKYQTRTSLPDEAVCSIRYNFSIANRLIWLFNPETSTWKGYSF